MKTRLWYGQMSRPSHSSLHQEGFPFENTQASLQSWMPGSNSETWGRFCDSLGSSFVVRCSVGPILTLHGWIAAREYVDTLGNQVHPMIHTVFWNNNAVFQDDIAPIHTAGTVQSWFEEDEGELQHVSWPAQSPDLNIIEQLWSVLETWVRNRFPPPTSLQEHKDVLQEEWYKILLEIVQNLYESTPRRTASVLKAKVGPTSYKKCVQYL
jgi:hypothetical protein